VSPAAASARAPAPTLSLPGQQRLLRLLAAPCAVPHAALRAPPTLDLLGQRLLHVAQAIQVQVRVRAVAVHGQDLRARDPACSLQLQACVIFAAQPFCD